MHLSYRGLHLGCFNCPADGWLNSDITPHIWVARIPGAASALFRLGKMTAERREEHRRGVFRKVRYLDVGKRFPFPNSSFPAVFSSHVLQQLPPNIARHCLVECFRVLRSGGICRIVVPDLDRLIASYTHSSPNEFLRAFYYDSDPNAKTRHNWYYNDHSLTALLLSIGFSRAYCCSYRQGCCPDLEKLDNRPGSLFVEAFK
jgi:SAM-dependent methyltransferase